MVCPLVILRDKSSAYSGLFPCEYPKPEWWSSAPTATAVIESQPTLPKRSTTLFDDMPEEVEEPARPTQAVKPASVPARDWIKRLLASPAYKDQKG